VTVHPFTIAVPDAALADLRDRIRATQSWFTRGTSDSVTVPTGAAVFRELRASFRAMR
jgi:hypothetical protein